MWAVDKGMAHFLVQDESKYSARRTGLLMTMGLEIEEPGNSREVSATEFDGFRQEVKNQIAKEGFCLEAYPSSSSHLKPFMPAAPPAKPEPVPFPYAWAKWPFEATEVENKSVELRGAVDAGGTLPVIGTLKAVDNGRGLVRVWIEHSMLINRIFTVTRLPIPPEKSSSLIRNPAGSKYDFTYFV
jgi:hypothetical protein